MPNEIDDIKKRMETLERLIRETKARLPAHSVGIGIRTCFLLTKP